MLEQFAAVRPAIKISEGAHLTEALQKTEISVDEEGTEAISMSFSGKIPGGAPGQERPQPFVVIMNRPFFFAIRRTGGGPLLFLAVEP
jgi:hypothetical protein